MYFGVCDFRYDENVTLIVSVCVISGVTRDCDTDRAGVCDFRCDESITMVSVCVISDMT